MYEIAAIVVIFLLLGAGKAMAVWEDNRDNQ